MSQPANKMKVLYIDIETAPNKGYFWGLWRQNIGINQIDKPGYTLCFAARWEGHKRVQFYSVKKDGMAKMLDKAYDLLDEADVVIHYNGKKFDIPTLNREFILHGYVPPTTYHQIDLYHIVRSTFKFASNKLDYVCQQLGLGTKVEHKGMDLWLGCMAGKRDDWRTMKEYNMRDVELLAMLYEKLQPWIRRHPNRGLYVENPEKPICPNCGSDHLHKKGIETTRVSRYQRYKCQECGANCRGRFRILPSGEEIVT